MPFVPVRHEQMLPYAALVQWTPAARLWQGQTQLLDPHDPFTYAAACGFRVPAGIGVTLMPFRHPMEAALQARSLALATGHPVVAGFGPGEADLQEAMLGQRYASPLTASREYVGTVRRLLAGEHVTLDGDYVRCDMSLYPVPHPGVEVGLGVLRPRMARVAGEVADVAVLWLAPAGYIADELVPPLRAGAAEAGRPSPRVVAIVPMCLEAAGRDPQRVALASNGAHLQGPHYQDMLRRAGIDVRPGDPQHNAGGLIDGGAFLTGDAEGIAKQIAAFHEAGVDEVVVNVTGVHQTAGSAAALAEIEAIVSAVSR